MNLFNKTRIGYVVIESLQLEKWKSFFVDGLGLHLAQESDDIVAFRMDSHDRRVIVKRGTSEDVVAIGVHADDEQTLQEILKRVRVKNINIGRGAEKEAHERGVEQFYRFFGPKKTKVEVYCKPIISNQPLKMLSSGFVTGDGGMGHFAITSKRANEMLAFWQDIFDARVSDYIEEHMSGVTLDITFTRLNERHHSIAIAKTRGLSVDPIRTSIQHGNMVAKSMDDMVSAFRRLKNLGFKMAHEIGQHPNDKELSFYAITPSGFEWELGFNALTVNEETWQSVQYQGISLWGHKPPKHSLLNTVSVNAGNLVGVIRSLFRTEYTPY